MQLMDFVVGVGAFVLSPLSDREDLVKKYETLINVIIIIILIINFTCHKEYRGSQKTLQPRYSRSRGVPCKLQEQNYQLTTDQRVLCNCHGINKLSKKPWPKQFHLLSICEKTSLGAVTKLLAITQLLPMSI